MIPLINQVPARAPTISNIRMAPTVDFMFSASFL
jgi:hypothetical protein